MEEVTGSSPVSSTNPNLKRTPFGGNGFRFFFCFFFSVVFYSFKPLHCLCNAFRGLLICLALNGGLCRQKAIDTNWGVLDLLITCNSMLLPYTNYPFKNGSFANLKIKTFCKKLCLQKSLPNIRLLHKVPLWAKNIVKNFCNIQKHPNGVKKIGNRGKPARDPRFFVAVLAFSAAVSVYLNSVLFRWWRGLVRAA